MAKNIQKYGPPLVQSIPEASTYIKQGLTSFANTVEQMKGDPEDVAMYSAAASAVPLVAANAYEVGTAVVSKSPTALLITGDALLAIGVAKEAKAALSGQCH